MRNTGRSRKLDEVDKKILSILIENSRTSIREIARELRLSPATIHERIKKLLERNIIRAFTILLDHRLIGYDVTALILMSVDGKHIVEVEEWLSRQRGVVAVYDITGEFDVAVIVKTRNITELNEFVKNILQNPYVKRTVTSVVFNVVKEDFRLPIIDNEG